MLLRVNGQEERVEGSLTVEGLLELRGLDGKPCAVEVNKALVPKRDHAACALAEGDTVEIVTLVGGG